MMRIIDELFGLVSSQIEMVKTFLSMVKLETKLAKLSVLPLFITLGLLVMTGFSLWLLTLVLGAYVLILSLQSILAALAITLFINFLLVLMLIKYASFNLRKMSFEQTRRFLSHIKDNSNELEKGRDSSDRCDKKALV